MVSKGLMDLWQRRGRTFSERSSLLQRAETIQGVMDESLLYLQCVKGIVVDVGCGDGIPTVSLVQGHQVIGVDFVSTMLSRRNPIYPPLTSLGPALIIFPSERLQYPRSHVSSCFRITRTQPIL